MLHPDLSWGFYGNVPLESGRLLESTSVIALWVMAFRVGLSPLSLRQIEVTRSPLT
ncbi:MAG: hypothetical protein AB4042_04255 [Leptolyngbyaceae cyanobacterium]